MANFSVEFTVEYSIKDKKLIKNFALPENAEVLKNSTCNKNSSVLAVGFSSHSLEMTFEKIKDSYSISNLIFRYNLSDASTFPNSTKGGIQEASAGTDVRAALNTTYRCINMDRINMTNVVITLSNVTLEAFLPNNAFSPKSTICSEDQSSTIAPRTTSAPTTSHAPITASPSPNPEVVKYNVTDSHGRSCLLASMGLQLNVTYPAKDKFKSNVLNLPKSASQSGTCDNSTIFLNLTFDQNNLNFSFAQNSSTGKFFLRGIDVSTQLPPEANTSQPFTVSNHTLSALKASVGKSYKCRAEENIWVRNDTFINIFDVQIQAFKIDGDNFGPVEECQLDENNMLIPIIVGAALAGLVLIVLIAYLIGRKRSHAGYQTI